jgi:hypothetical protein
VNIQRDGQLKKSGSWQPLAAEALAQAAAVGYNPQYRSRFSSAQPRTANREPET